MSTEFYRPAREPDAEGLSVNVSPQNVEWTYCSLRVLNLHPNKPITFATCDSEWIVLPLSGSCTVSCANETFELEGRTSVFERVTDFAYVPRDASVSIYSKEGGRFAFAGAIAREALPARYGPAEL